MRISARNAPLVSMILLMVGALFLTAAWFFFWDPSVIPTAGFQCNGVSPCPSTRGGYAVAITCAWLGTLSIIAGVAVRLRRRNPADF